MKHVIVSITDQDGVVLDRFAVSHYLSEEPLPKEFGADYSDWEGYGSWASDSLLVARIRRAAGE